ncbi:MAG: FAD-binding protein [Flavobacteriaceae bacterium]
MERFEIVIAGGGPAGMSAAAELSKEFKVLVVEKKKPGTTQSTWYSYADRAKKYNLEEAVAVRTDYIKFTAPTAEHFMKDQCVIFDHDKVLQIWMERAKANGARVRQEAFVDYQRDDQGIIVLTSKGKYHAELVVDCMGINSPIVQKNKLIKRKDAWVIYGAKLSNVQFENPYQLEYLPLNDEENTYIGIHPHSETETNIYAFKGQKNTLGNPDELRDKFEKYIAEVQPNAKRISTLRGTIVSGTLKKYALDHIIFFGSSGMLNPDGCGMGFNQILMKHQIFANGIREVMETRSLDRKSLKKVAHSLIDKETINFQKIIGAFSLYFIRSAGKWDGGVKWLNAMGEDSKYWMRNEMSMDWIKRANIRLNSVIPLKETFKMIPMADLMFIMGQLIRFKIKSLRNGRQK